MTALPPPRVEPCRSCQAMIVWAKMPSGKWSPFDAKPERRFLLVTGDDGVLQAQPQPTFQTHFASCPNADQHRRPS